MKTPTAAHARVARKVTPMSDNLRDRIADEDEKHYQMLATDGGWLCACSHRFSGNTYREWRLHKADAVIEALAVKHERKRHSHPSQYRYVTGWTTDEPPPYCNRCGRPHHGQCLREENR